MRIEMEALEKLEQLLPHRHPMVFIDRLLGRDAHSAMAVKTFAPGDYALVDGVVAEAALIECLAQTAAAIGPEAVTHTERASMGMLVSVDEFVFHGSVRELDTIELTAEITQRLAPFCFVRGTVKCGGRLIAEGTFKVMEPA